MTDKKQTQGEYLSACQGNLAQLASRLKGIGVAMKNMNGDFPISDPSDLIGLGEIIAELAARAQVVADGLDEVVIEKAANGTGPFMTNLFELPMFKKTGR